MGAMQTKRASEDLESRMEKGFSTIADTEAKLVSTGSLLQGEIDLMFDSLMDTKRKVDRMVYAFAAVGLFLCIIVGVLVWKVM